MNWRPYFTASNDPGAASPKIGLRILNFLLALLLVALVLYFSFARLAFHLDWSAIYDYRWKLLNGWLITIAISAAALVGSGALGLFFALARRSAFLPLRYFSIIYVRRFAERLCSRRY